MAFVVTGTGTRTAVAYETSPTLAAKLIVNYQAGTPVNQPPVVNAGPDLNASLSPATHIAGSVTDDGMPGPVTISWTKVSGPGTATFAPANAAVTDVTFSLVGSYTLQLSASDGQYTVNDTVVVTVSTATPITLNLAVATGNDDAEQGGSSMDRGGPSLEMVMNGSTNQYVGIRFTGVTIPAGAVVTSAYLQFTNAVNNSSVASLVVAAQAADNPAGFGNGNNDISNRPRTAATVAWAPVAWTTVGAAGVDQRTPDLTAVVQQVVSRAGWASGNALVFIITGSAGTRSATSFNGSSTNQPKLVITYHM
jgi:hypothetical protein